MIFLSPLVMKLIAGAVVLAVIGGTIAYWSIHQYNKGYAQAITDIAAKNKEAVDAVNSAKTKVDECFNRGDAWEWDATRGVCRAK
jgi:uncharacterized protein (UPF0333 family)